MTGDARATTFVTQSPDKTYDALLEIGEECRHVLCHIRDSKCYGYLHDELPAPPAKAEE